jgi:hypothetical protein
MSDTENMARDDISKESDLTVPVLEKEIKDVIPNGGTVAWLQVLGSFLLLFNSW